MFNDYTQTLGDGLEKFFDFRNSVSCPAHSHLYIVRKLGIRWPPWFIVRTESPYSDEADPQSHHSEVKMSELRADGPNLWGLLGVLVSPSW